MVFSLGAWSFLRFNLVKFMSMFGAASWAHSGFHMEPLEPQQEPRGPWDAPKDYTEKFHPCVVRFFVRSPVRSSVWCQGGGWWDEPWRIEFWVFTCFSFLEISKTSVTKSGFYMICKSLEISKADATTCWFLHVLRFLEISKNECNENLFLHVFRSSYKFSLLFKKFFYTLLQVFPILFYKCFHSLYKC